MIEALTVFLRVFNSNLLIYKDKNHNQLLRTSTLMAMKQLSSFLLIGITPLVLLSGAVNAANVPAKDAPKADREIIIKRLKSNMVLVEGGSFTMGSDDEEADEREKPAHQVTLDSFYIASTEMTQDIFEQVAGYNYSYFQCDTCPINNVSWMNIIQFIKKLNTLTGMTFRLPTEAEWEYAAKGGQQSKGYAFSGSNDIADVAWYADNAKRKLHPVAQKEPNELGLYDMTGNVWEFVQDDMEAKLYSKKPRTNPLFDIGMADNQTTLKATRGGGYEFSAKESYVFRRDGATSNVRMPDIGFRLAMDASKGGEK